MKNLTAMVLAAPALMLAACDSSSSSACGPFDGCGGDVTGSWTFQSLCASASAQDPDCPEATIDFSEVKLAGTMTFNADKTFASNMTASGNIKMTLPTKCLMVQGITLTCAQVDMALKMSTPGASCSGSSSCTCRLPLEDSMPEMGSGTWRTMDKLLFTKDTGSPEESSLEYCVSGSTLKVKDPPMMMPGMMAEEFGTMILVRK